MSTIGGKCVKKSGDFSHNPLTGVSNSQANAASNETITGKDNDIRHEPDKDFHKPAISKAANGKPNHHSNQPTSQTITGTAR